MNIYEKMLAITGELTAVAKNLNVGYGKNSYKAVGEADVLAAVKPLEAKYGVYSYPYSRKVIDTAVLENEKEYNGEKTVTRQLMLRVETVYRFANAEKPEEYIDITTYGDGVDPQDKAPGKAMTYADKYALLKAYKIITGDDPDQIMSGALKSAQKTSPKEHAAAAYPSRDEMIAFISANYDDENMVKLLGYYAEQHAKKGEKEVSSLNDLNDAEIMACYARKAR